MRQISWGVLFIFLIANCSEPDYVPKPKGYFRIDLPNHTYQKLEKDCPYSFDFSSSALVKKARNSSLSDCWFNIEYPVFNATVHLSYKAINSDTAFETYSEDARNFVYKHTVKASGIEEHVYENTETNCHGIVYELNGNTASPLQFFVTDSNKHFIRGALYFNQLPNEDSLKPVISFLQEDINHLIESTTWK